MVKELFAVGRIGRRPESPTCRRSHAMRRPTVAWQSGRDRRLLDLVSRTASKAAARGSHPTPRERVESPLFRGAVSSLEASFLRIGSHAIVALACCLAGHRFMANVFVSHRGADSAEAERLAEEIRRAGH